MNTHETATLGGGCFWCLEAVFDELRGVQRVVSGYAGGLTPDPTYEEVCSELTGHAEVVQVTFDPTTLPYRDLLKVFFGIHDPTTLNRQGADVGTQYRSVIFYHSPEQQKIAQQVMQELTREKIRDQPIVTQLVPSVHFYPAEPYHQKYFQRNPTQPYCQAVINPKLAKFRGPKSHSQNRREPAKGEARRVTKTAAYVGVREDFRETATKPLDGATGFGSGSKLCASCGKPFPCNPGNCWCDAVSVSEEKRTKIQRQFQGCLCQKCLLKFSL